MATLDEGLAHIKTILEALAYSGGSAEKVFANVKIVKEDGDRSGIVRPSASIIWGRTIPYGQHGRDMLFADVSILLEVENVGSTWGEGAILGNARSDVGSKIGAGLGQMIGPVINATNYIDSALNANWIGAGHLEYIDADPPASTTATASGLRINYQMHVTTL